MGTPPGWGLEHRATNPVSVKNVNDTETSATASDEKVFRPYVPERTKRTSSSSSSSSSST